MMKKIFIEPVRFYQSLSRQPFHPLVAISRLAQIT